MLLATPSPVRGTYPAPTRRLTPCGAGDHTGRRFFRECGITTEHSTVPQSPCSGRGLVVGRRLDRPAPEETPGEPFAFTNLDDSLNSAIHTRYRSLLHSSSMHEPRDPLSEVVNIFNQHITQSNRHGSNCTKERQSVKRRRTWSEAQGTVTYSVRCSLI